MNGKERQARKGTERKGSHHFVMARQENSFDTLITLPPTSVISSLDAPNNNKSGQQLVSQAAIDIPSNIEVPINSGPQPVPQAAIDIPSNMEVSINSGPQLVSKAAIDIPSNIEVPINSGPQPVPQAAIDIPSNMEVSINSGPQDGNNNGNWRYAAFVGCTNCASGIIALTNKPPSSSEPVYIMAEVTVFTAGILGVMTALWVSRDARNRRAAERVTLSASIITAVFGLFVNAYALK